MKNKLNLLKKNMKRRKLEKKETRKKGNKIITYYEKRGSERCREHIRLEGHQRGLVDDSAGPDKLLKGMGRGGKMGMRGG